MQQEAGAPTCLGGSILHPWPLTGSLVLFGVQLEPGDSLNYYTKCSLSHRPGQDGAEKEPPSSQLLGFSRRSPSSVTRGTGKGLALPLGVLFLVTMFKAE